MGKNSENIDVNFEQLVRVFNEDGREAAERFVETECNNSYTVIQRRL